MKETTGVWVEGRFRSFPPRVEAVCVTCEWRAGPVSARTHGRVSALASAHAASAAHEVEVRRYDLLVILAP